MKSDLFLDYASKQNPKASSQRHEHLTFRGNVSNGRHGWLRLTPAFSLHIVREILEANSKDDFVLDPFSGTGTTPLTSAALGIPAHAVDINPFLVWFGNLKVAKYDATTAEAFRLEAKRIACEVCAHAFFDATWIPELHQIEKWWEDSILKTLAHLFALITHSKRSQTVVDLLKIAFCRSLIEASNVSFGHQSMSFKKNQASNQSSFINEEQYFDSSEYVVSKFLSAAEGISQSLLTDQPAANVKIFLGDSRNLEKVLPERGYTKVVTSPPYPNRMSYIRELRPYMYWLGFLTNGRQAGELDWAAIGGTWGCATSNLSSWQPAFEKVIPFPHFDQIVSSINLKNKLLGQYIHKYFEDIKDHLHSLRRVMARNGKCYYIVGNSKFYGTLLPVEEIYSALFHDCGFKNMQVRRFRKRSSKKELYEYVVYAEVDK